MTAAHTEKETLHVDVNIPEHADRTATALFEHTRKLLLAASGNRCHTCNELPSIVGPLEAHHNIVERAMANEVDWRLVMADAMAGELGETQRQRDACKAFDWVSFMHGVNDEGDVPDPYPFVDNMLLNGKLLCKPHHTGKDTGEHMAPGPIFKIQRYAKAGYQFDSVEVIRHGKG